MSPIYKKRTRAADLKHTRYSADEIKALALFYGSYEKAAKKLKIGKASLVDAGNADIKGKSYSLSRENYRKVERHFNSLSESSQRNVRKYESLLNSISDHPNVKRAFMNTKQSDREWTKLLRDKKGYKQLDDSVFWTKVMSKFYDKYGWRKGQWKR